MAAARVAGAARLKRNQWKERAMARRVCISVRCSRAKALAHVIITQWISGTRAENRGALVLRWLSLQNGGARLTANNNKQLCRAMRQRLVLISAQKLNLKFALHLHRVALCRFQFETFVWRRALRHILYSFATCSHRERFFPRFSI